MGALAWTWVSKPLWLRGASPPPEGVSGAVGEGAAPRPTPTITVEKTFHNFGIMDPAEACEHVFTIRNEGEAPLELRRGPTSCQCTMSYVPEEAIPPGAAVPVRVASKLDQEQGEFSHEALIFTNDPAKHQIKLTITGTIRDHIGAYPPRIVFANLARDAACSARSVVYSQIWGRFTIAEVKPSQKGLTWKITPADPGRLAELDARSGYEIEVTTPEDLPGGTFTASLQMSVVPAEASGEPRRLTLPMTGKVPAFASLRGSRLNALRDVVELGVVRRGEGAETRLLLTVRDKRRLTIEEIESDPEFLQVRVDPVAEKGGSYRISVWVPPDAPPSNFSSDQKAEVRIRTDHPRLPLVKFQVEFAVTGHTANFGNESLADF
jgi:hypothetical protein